MKSAQTNSIMTVKEVADYLKVSVSTVYRLAQDGSMPARKVGGTWRFSQAAIDSWFTTQDTELVGL